MPEAALGMVYSWLANLVLLVHLVFVVFVVLGGLLALRWPRVAWVHIPAVIWGAWVEASMRICPLTPLENRFLRLAGEEGYAGGFLEQYLIKALYPSGLSSSHHLTLGAAVLALNLCVYGLVIKRYRSSREPR